MGEGIVMDPQSLLAHARELGATFALAEGDKLKVRAPVPLPEDLLEELRRHKAQIIALLNGSLEAKAGESNTTSPEVIARSILAENETEEAVRILAIWKEHFGLRLDRGKVLHQLKGLRQWDCRWGGNK